MFKWNHLIDALKSMGYTGPATDLISVQAFLKGEGMSPDEVDLGGDETANVAKLYAQRDGKPVNLSEARKNAEFEARVQAEVAKTLEATNRATGRERSEGDTERKHLAITGGKERLADDPKGGFPHMGEFFKAVQLAGTRDTTPPEQLVAYQKATLTTYGSEGVGADGGFAVPPEFRESINSLVQSNESMMSRCDQLPISTAGISLPDDETTPWGSDGIRSYWEGEADALAQSKPSLKQKDYRLRKLTTLVPVTEELLEDAVALGSYIEGVAPERITWEVDEAITRGTGAGQPLGFLNSPSLVTAAAVGSQVADTISGQNIFDMYTRMYSRYRGGAVWLVSHDAETEILKLSVTGQAATGAANTNYGFPLYSPPGLSRDGGQYGTLMGRPVIVTEHAAALGDVGDIMFVSLPEYRCVMRSGGIQAAQSMHLWFDQDAIAYKFRIRVDGAPKLSTTISPRTGSSTMSAFVTLAARA